MQNQIVVLGATLVWSLAVVPPAQAGLEDARTRAPGTEGTSALAEQLIAAHSLSAKKADPVSEAWSYMSLRMPRLAVAALKNARGQTAPITAAIFEGEIARLQSAQNSTASEILATCLKAESSHELFSVSVSELQGRCAGRLWTNESDGALSIYLTNPLPICEVRIPLASLKGANSSSNAFRAIAQPLRLVTEIGKLSFVLPVVNLTDSTASKQVEVRCLGRWQRPGDAAWMMRSGTSHVFTVVSAEGPQSEAAAQAALEQSILALCIEAAEFIFPREKPPRK